VLSCIVADIPGRLTGTAPMASVYLAQTEDNRTENKIEEDNLVAGLELADSLGCDIINISLGYIQFDDTIQPSRTYKDLTGTSRASLGATIAASKGIIICNSAGNEGDKQWKRIGSPADAKDILTVGAINIFGKRAGFSSYGPTADGRIKPDACAVGECVFAVNPNGKGALVSGTSFSSPMLSGMVACLWQMFPQKTNYEIMEAIRKSGNQANKPNASLGYGITDFFKAYNILQCPQTINNGKMNVTVDINNFVLTNKPLVVTILSSEMTTVEVQLYHNEKPLLESKKYKVKKGKTTLKIKYPAIFTSNDFEFLDFQMAGENFKYNYLMGVEKEINKKK
jgi:hypothetical protein